MYMIAQQQALLEQANAANQMYGLEELGEYGYGDLQWGSETPDIDALL